jgi:site-specific DNA recombinase
VTLRAALYLRVSSAEQMEGYSIEAQRYACIQFAAARDYAPDVVYVEEGRSAFTDNIAKRPAFQQMLEDAAAGKFGVIVVHKMDRFARKLRTCLECLESLGKMHVGVVSVSEPNLDYSTPQGFLFLSMLGALAEWYSRNLSVETAKGWQQRKRQGLYAGRLPWGMRKGEDGIPIPDPETHPGLLLAFTRAAGGATDTEVAEALNAAGYRPNATAARARFTRDSTRTMLQNRFYVGELPIGKRGKDGWLPGAHGPVVPPELFVDVQRLRGQRALDHRASHVPRSATVYALSGLLICGACGEPMEQGGTRAHPRFICVGRRQGTGCRASSIGAATADAQVGHYLKRLRLPADLPAQILDAYRREKPEVDARAQARHGVELRIRRLQDMYEMGDIDRTTYERRRNALRAELGQMPNGEVHADPVALGQLLGRLSDAALTWDHSSPETRNKLLRLFFAGVTITAQRVTHVQPKPEFQPFLVLAETDERTGQGTDERNGQKCDDPVSKSDTGSASRGWRARGDTDPQPPTSEADAGTPLFAPPVKLPLARVTLGYEALRARIAELRAQGLTQAEVGRLVGLSDAGVSWHERAEARKGRQSASG